MKKKFKVRVNFAHGKYYYVQYANYYFIPVFHSLKEFNSAFGYNCEFTGIENGVFTLQNAENEAIKLKSIDDVNIYNDKQQKIAQDFREKEKQYNINFIKNKTPYNVKYFL